MENPISTSSKLYVSKDNDEECVMHSKSDNIEIMIKYKADEVIEHYFSHFYLDIEMDWKHQWNVAILYLILFIYCIRNAIK